MGNRLGLVSRILNYSNDEEYERLLPLSAPEEDDSFENMEVEQSPQGALEDDPIDNIEVLERFLQESTEDVPIENVPFEDLEALERFLQGATEDVSIENLEPLEQPQQAAWVNDSVDYLEFLGQPQHAALVNGPVDYLEPLEQPQNAFLINGPVDYLEPLEQPQNAFLVNGPVDYLESLEQPQNAFLVNGPVDYLEALEQPQQAALVNGPVDYLQPLEQPQNAALVNGPVDYLEPLEQPQYAALMNGPVDYMEALEQPQQAALEDAPVNHLGGLEQYLQDILEAIPFENFESPEQFASEESLQAIEQFLQVSPEEISTQYMEPPEQQLQGVPDDAPLIDFGTPEQHIVRAPERLSYYLRVFQCFPSVIDQEEFYGEEGNLYGPRFRGEANLVYKRVPIELILNDDSSTYISHVSTFTGLAREGTYWRLSNKTVDLTIIKSTRPHKPPKYFRFERDPADNKWALVVSRPYKNEYQGKRFSALILGVTVIYLRGNTPYGKYINLTKAPELDLPPDAMGPGQCVLHITTYDVQLEKKTDKLFFPGREEDGAGYYVEERSPRSFTPNFFARCPARNYFHACF